MTLRFTPARLALSYIALCVLALALLAVPLWYGFQANLGTFRAYVPGAEMQRFVDLFHRDGAQAVAAALDAYAARLPPDQVAVFAGPQKQRLAGNLPRWPAEVPDEPGTYGLVIGTGGDASMRVVASHVTLPGGYQLLMGRESVRFESLVERFWSGITEVVVIMLVLGIVFAWLLRRTQGALEAVVSERSVQLSASEERYARAMLAAEAGFWDWDVAKDEFYVSPKLLEMTDFPPGTKLAGRADFMARAPFHPDDRVRWERAVKELFLSGGTRLAMEMRSIHGGETRWALLSGMCVRDAAGKVVRWTGSATEITARKDAEMALRQSDERYARVIEASEDGFWEWIVASDAFYASPRMLALYGLAPDTVFRGRADFLARFPFHAEDLEVWRTAVAAHLAGQTKRVDIEVRAKVQGKTRWMHLAAICQRDAAGVEERWTGSVSDVTERRRAQEALHVSEDRYARAMEGSDAGHWDWNIVSDEMFVSERAREMMALPAGALPARRAELMELVPMHPDDRAAMADVVKTSIQSGVHERDYRVIPQPGEVRWLRSRAKVYKDARGAAVRMTGSLIDITERKVAADALRASEERYALAMEASDEGYVDVNVDTDEFVTSERLNEIFGIAPGTRFSGRSDFLDQFRFYGNDGETYRQAIRASDADGGSDRYEFEFRIVRPSGEVRWLRTRGKVIRDAEGRARRRVGVFADITERKRAEQALLQSQERYALAMEAAGDGHTDWNLVSGEFYISPRMLRIVGHPPDATFADRADWVRRFPFHPEDRKRWEAALAAHFAGNESKFRMDLRIVVNGETRWVAFTFIATRDPAGNPVRWTGSIADINDAKLAEQALRESQERYALAVAGSDDGIWDCDFAYRRVFVSARARELVGMPPGPDMVPMDEFFGSLPVHPEDVPRRTAAREAHLAGKTPAYVGEFRLLQPDGVYRWRRIHGLCTRDANGNPDRMAGSISDIDARKRAEESLRLSEERYALALEASEEGHFDVDLESGEIFASARLNEIYGFPRHAKTADRVEYLNQVPFHPDDRHLLADIAGSDWEDPARVNRLERYSLRIVPRPGETRWIQTHAKVVRDAEGRARRRVGVIADITERKLAEEARRLSEQRYALAMEVAEEGHFDWNVQTDEIFSSAQALRVLGLPQDADIRTRADVTARVRYHPDDWPRISAEWREALAGRGTEHEFEYRILRGDEPRWIRGRWKIFRDAHGIALRVIGVVADVTQRKRAEEALRVSEERYALAMEASEEGHFDWNVQTDEMFASAHMKKLLGLPVEEEYRTRDEMSARVRYYPGDHERLEQMNRDVLASGALQSELEYRILRGDEVRWLRRSWKIMRDAAGAALRVIGVLSDITERKLAEAALRVSDERYALAMEASAEGHFDTDLETDQTFISARLAEIYGFPRQAKVEDRVKWVEQIPFHPDDRHLQPNLLRPEWEDATRNFYEFQYRVVVRGETRWIQTRGLVMRDAGGRARRRVGVVADITERKRFEEQLRSRQEMLDLAQKSARAVPWEWRNGADPEVNKWSPELCAMFGLPPGGFDGTAAHWWRLCHPDDWPRVKSAVAQTRASGEIDIEYRVVHPDASVHWLNQKGRAFFGADRKPLRSIGFMFEITERKRAEESLRLSEAFLREGQKLARVGNFAWQVRAGEIEWSEQVYRIFEFEPASRVTLEQIAGRVHPEDASMMRDMVERAQQGVSNFEYEHRVVMPDGRIKHVHLVAHRTGGEADRLEYIGAVQDITERKGAEEALRQSEERYALAVSGSNEGIFDWDLPSDRVYVSHRAQELFGLQHGELWRPRRDWRHIITFHPDDAPRLHDSIKAHIEGSAPTYDVEFRIVLAGGGVRWFRQRGVALRDASGKAYRVVGSIGDVTGRHIVEEELKAMERKLRLAQRLESMGTLAGGIAHDFNNILGAILGYGEMALRDAPKGSRLRRDLDSIVTAGERGRALVDRVLAFSRSGVGERAPVHVEKVVREALDLVSAKLPPDVTLHAKLHAGRAAMQGDATQVHQVLMNLAMNAVQAMPKGGTLRVSLEALRMESARAPTIGIVHAAEYLVLKVADTGSGIAPEIMERIFDPFFTTKEVGTGTGLGLSLVHGIVAEVGGAIDVASTPGAGSTFTVYLPRSGEAADDSLHEEADLPRGEGQRVLIVDDEEPLVTLATRTLEELGYVPTGFTSSAAALAAFRADPQRFDAVITDERMPGMSGSALIREVRGIRGRIPIVLMSGYVGGAIASRAREAGAEEVLKKPLSARDLAASLARVLHS